MLYGLGKYLEGLDVPGAGMMQYLSFRGAAAIILALMIALVFGGGIIRLLRRVLFICKIIIYIYNRLVNCGVQIHNGDRGRSRHSGQRADKLIPLRGVNA